MIAVTQWFTEGKPSRTGVYERNYPLGGIQLCLWNGRYFGIGEATLRDALVFGYCASTQQELPWRGLADKPK